MQAFDEIAQAAIALVRELGALGKTRDNAVQTLVSDEGLNPQYIEEFSRLGIRVLIAPRASTPEAAT